MLKIVSIHRSQHIFCSNWGLKWEIISLDKTYFYCSWNKPPLTYLIKTITLYLIVLRETRNLTSFIRFYFYCPENQTVPACHIQYLEALYHNVSRDFTSSKNGTLKDIGTVITISTWISDLFFLKHQSSKRWIYVELPI